MKLKGTRPKIKAKIKIYIDGEWCEGDINVVIDKLSKAYVNEVFNFYMQTARTKADAVQWTADFTGYSISRVKYHIYSKDDD